MPSKPKKKNAQQKPASPTPPERKAQSNAYETEARKERAISLWYEGLSYGKIATVLQEHKTQIERWVRSEIKRLAADQRESLNEMRVAELARLNDIEEKLFYEYREAQERNVKGADGKPLTLPGNPVQRMFALKLRTQVSARRAKILGLEVTRIEADVSGVIASLSNIGDDELRAMAAALIEKMKGGSDAS